LDFAKPDAASLSAALIAAEERVKSLAKSATTVKRKDLRG